MTKKRDLPLAGIVLASSGTACLAVLVYFAYHYGWTGGRQFTSWGGVAVYYVLPAAFAALFFVSLKLRQTFQTLLAVFCVLLAPSAYGIELFLSVKDSGPSIPVMDLPPSERGNVAARLSQEYGVDIDIRDRKEVIADLRKKGIEAVPQIVLPPLEKQADDPPPPDIEANGTGIMPLAGIADNFTVVGNENGQYFSYRSDRHGFNNLREVWTLDRIDIAAVGNSTMLGCCVRPDKSLVALLRNQYPNTLNLGMTGEGPLHILATLEEYAASLKPKRVLWLYSEETSFLELQNEKQSPILMGYLKDNFTQHLQKRQSEVDRTVAIYLDYQDSLKSNWERIGDQRRSRFGDQLIEFAKLSALRHELGLVYGASTTSDPALPELRANLALLKEILTKAALRIRGWEGSLHLVYIPSPNRLLQSDESATHQYLELERTEVLKSASALGLSVIDLFPAFQAHEDPLSLLPFRGPGHYNEAGHRLVAEAIISALRNAI